jgi:hypothetical protein
MNSFSNPEIPVADGRDVNEQTCLCILDRRSCIIACYSDPISYEEKATPHPGPVRAIRIC